MKKTPKKETVKVDMDFLMKMANEIDVLNTKVKELQTPKEALKDEQPKFEYTVSLKVSSLDQKEATVKSFIADLSIVLSRYNVNKLILNYKK
jgi:hypothetical protein